MTRRELKLLAKLDEMVVKSQKHGTGRALRRQKKVVQGNQNVADLPRPVQSLKISRRLAPGAMSAAAAMTKMEVLKDGKLVVSLVVHYAT